MNDETKRAIWIVGRWLNESVSAAELDSLLSHVCNERVDSNLKFELADELRVTLGAPAFD